VGPGAQTKAVFFWKAVDGKQFFFDKPIEVPAGEDVEMRITNIDRSDQDMYGFINGEEV
jgi:hypothetical protein